MAGFIAMLIAGVFILKALQYQEQDRDRSAAVCYILGMITVCALGAVVT